MCIYIYIYLYTCIPYIHIVYTTLQRYTCILCMHACMHARTYNYIYIYICIDCQKMVCKGTCHVPLYQFTTLSGYVPLYYST